MTKGENPIIPNLLRTLDQETRFWSAGYEEHPAYRSITKIGEAALKPLFESIDDEDGPSWAHLQLIWHIAADIDKPVVFDETERGKYVPVVATTINWGRTNGYLETEQD